MEKTPLPRETDGEHALVYELNNDDFISRLSNDILLKILAKLSTEETVKTSILSRRWLHVWKGIPFLFLDMTRIAKSTTSLSDVNNQACDAAKSVTQVIKDHRGHLERCIIYHYSDQYENEMVKSWIQSLVHVKHVKHLTLVNFSEHLKPSIKPTITLDLSPNSFSHKNLESLILGRYILKAPEAFNNCSNLKNLKLVGIFAEIEAFNAVLVSCPSLQVLFLQITCHKRSGPLKIKNPNLKFLFLSCSKIDGIEVSSSNLDIFIVGSVSCEIEHFVITSPKLQFYRSYWTTGKFFPHISYNISCSHEEKQSIAHEYMMSEASEYMTRFASMSVSVNLANAKELDMLQEVLSAWPGEMGEIEILFKNENVANEDGESSVEAARNKFLEEAKPFPNAYFRVYNVWLSNFTASEEEFVFVSLLITQGTVVRTMMIKPPFSSPSEKLEIEAAFTRLKELPKGHKELCIVQF